MGHPVFASLGVKVGSKIWLTTGEGLRHELRKEKACLRPGWALISCIKRQL